MVTWTERATLRTWDGYCHGLAFHLKRLQNNRWELVCPAYVMATCFAARDLPRAKAEALRQLRNAVALRIDVSRQLMKELA